MSVEAYIPYDLRERLASQIEIIDKMMTDAIAAERERWTRKCAELEALYKSLLDTMVEQRHMVPPPPVIAENAGPAVAAERERCERVLLALLHESYDMTGPQALQRALSEIRNEAKHADHGT